MLHFRRFLYSFLIFVAVCAGGLMYFVHHEVEKGFRNAVANIDGLTVTYDDLSVSLLYQNVTLSHVVATLADGQVATAENLVIEAFDERNPIPHFVKLHAEKTTFRPGIAGRNLAMTTNWCDIKELHGDVVFEYGYDGIEQSLTLETLSFSDPDLGSFNLNGTITNIDLDAPHLASLIGLHIQDASLRFEDSGLMAKVLHRAAKDMGTTEEQVQKQLCQELAVMADYAGHTGNGVAESALRGGRRFVASPGKVSIAILPSSPISCLSLILEPDMYTNLRHLNVSVETDSGDSI